jgi:hypothetical protein
MGTGAPPYITHRRDRLPLADALAFVNKDFRQMGIFSFDLLTVV